MDWHLAVAAVGAWVGLLVPCGAVLPPVGLGGGTSKTALATAWGRVVQQDR